MALEYSLVSMLVPPYDPENYDAVYNAIICNSFP